MDGNLERFITVATLALTLGAAGCDRPEKAADPLPDATTEQPRPRTMPGVPLAEWVDRVQAVRDREFEQAPGIAPVTEPRKRVAPDAVRNDRNAILLGLFGDTSWKPAQPPELDVAWWDGAEQVVKLRTDIDVDPAVREQAVLLALLRGLDAQHAPDAPAPDTWDAWLAAESLRLGPAYFALTVLQASDVRDELSAEQVATFPGVAAQLPVADTMFDPADSIAERAATFGPRQGHGLAAAMYRASGWSGVEMLWHDQPNTTAWIVRPDRWLAGDGVGDWEWPKIPTEIRKKDGWSLDGEGRIGPAITSLFLSTAVGPARARIVYVNWLADTYRTWTKGDDWLFEWATMWATPTAAEEFVAAAERALQKQGRDGRFAVLRQGTTVAILGSNADADLDRHATSVVAMRPKFTPRDPGMLRFVPTPADVAADGIAEAALDDDVWSDPYLGITIDTTPVASWDLRRANELSLRWFARQDGALVQFSTELPRPLAPELADDAWRDHVVEGFRKTVPDLKVVRAERADFAGRKGWSFELEGTIDGRASRVILKQAMSEPDRGTKTPRVVTLSLQAPAELASESPAYKAFDALVPTIAEPFERAPQNPQPPEEGGLLPRNDPSD
jgi:hypothetical protein